MSRKIKTHSGLQLAAGATLVATMVIVLVSCGPIEAGRGLRSIGGTWESECQPSPLQIAPGIEPAAPPAEPEAEPEDALSEGGSYRQRLEFNGIKVISRETLYEDELCERPRGLVETNGRFRIGTAAEVDPELGSMDLDFSEAFLTPLTAEYAAELNAGDENCAPGFWRINERQEITHCPSVKKIWDEPFYTAFLMKRDHLYLGKYSVRRHGRDPEHRAVNIDRDSPLRKKK